MDYESAAKRSLHNPQNLAEVRTDTDMKVISLHMHLVLFGVCKYARYANAGGWAYELWVSKSWK